MTADDIARTPAEAVAADRAEEAVGRARYRAASAPSVDQRHAAAVECCAADGVDAPPPPDQMIASIQARHPGALRWAGIVFGSQTGYERDWKHLYEIEVEDLRDDFVAMHKRAMAAEAEVASLRAALSQAQADAQRLLAELHAADELNLFRSMLDLCGLDNHRVTLEALDEALDRHDYLGLGVVVRRVLATQASRDTSCSMLSLVDKLEQT